jgi:hypothetical protein
LSFVNGNCWVFMFLCGLCFLVGVFFSSFITYDLSMICLLVLLEVGLSEICESVCVYIILKFSMIIMVKLSYEDLFIICLV